MIIGSYILRKIVNMQKLDQNCAVCQQPCTKFCGNCKKVSYCSVEHQKCHRKDHKTDCYPGIVIKDEAKGRYVVASRDIKPGEKIMKDKALISAPNGNTASHFDFRPMCLGCYRLIASEDSFCSSCAWPVCSVDCEKMACHAENECLVFAKNKISPFTQTQDYEFIKIIRTLLLREQKPEKWAQILELESHETAREKMPLCIKKTFSAVMFIRNTCNLTQFDYKTINFVVGVFRVNAFGLHNWPSEKPGFKEGSFLFYNVSMYAHNCVPNTRSYLTEESKGHKSTFWQHVIATVPIKEGEPICKSYIEIKLGTPERRKLLNRGYHFPCSCARCSDRSELGLLYSAIKCQHCEKGYLVLEKPLDFNSNWKCILCNTIRPKGEMEFLVSFVEEEFRSVITEINENEDVLEGIEKLEEILRSHQEKSVHKNHWLMIEVEIEIIKRWRQLVLDSTRPLDKHIRNLAPRLAELSRHCLNVGGTLRPGCSIFRGSMLLSLAQAMAVLITNPGSNSDGDVEYLRRLKELKATGEEGYNILLFDPEGSDERKWGNAMWLDTCTLNF